MKRVKPGVVKVVQVGYKLDETAQALPAVRMLLGYGFSCFFMTMALASNAAHVQCLFVVATMVTLFVLEPIQYQCSCMLPLFLFPISRLLVAHKLFGVYMNDEILRSISSVLVGLIALKSPLSRRLCLWFLCLTGVRVRRVLLGVMLLVFLVSMLVDATMTTGILAGFVDPLIFEIYANNLRLRYAEHVRGGLKEADDTLTEVDFVFKDPPKQRHVVSGEARMDDTVEEVTQEVEPMFTLDSEGDVHEMVMVMDRDQPDEARNLPNLPTVLPENPEMRREQLSETLRSFGIDLQKMGLKLELQDTAVGTKSVKTVGYATAVVHPSGRETALLLDDDSADWESRFSMDTLKRECIGKSEGGGKKIDKSSRTREGKGRSPKASYKRRAVSKEGLSEKIKDSASSSSFMTPRGEANPPLEDDAPVSRQRGGPKLASTAHGKNRSSKTHGAPTWKASQGSDIIRQDSADDAKSTDKANAAQKRTLNDQEAAEHTRALRFRPHGQEGKGQETKSLLETRSFSKATTPAASSPQHVLFSHVVYPAPSIPTSCDHAVDTGSALANCFLHERIAHSHSVEHEKMVCQERRAARDSQGPPRDSNASQWSTTAMIGTSECDSNYVVNETHPSKRHCETHKKPAFSDKVFGAAEIKDFVFDFSGHMPGVKRCQSRRRKDVLKSKRRLLRRKRKSIDLPKASAHCEGPVHDSIRTEEETRCSPLDKAWVDRVDEAERYNPLLATDVSFRLRHSWSKRGLLWHVTRFCAERGDSLRNLFTRQQQVAVAETALLYKSGPKAASKHTDGTSSGENNEKSNDAESEEGCEKKHDSPRKAQAGGARGDYENDQTRGRRETRDRSRAEAAAGGGGPHDHVPQDHEQGGGARELENIIMEEKEKAKELRAAVLLALTYGASFGAAAAHGASNANVYFKKYIEMNAEVPSASLNLHTWLLVHVPFCLALVIIAARIIYYVHTRNYDILETATAPKSNVVIRDRLHIMGQVSYGEYIAAFLVGTGMILLIFREPKFMENGWGTFLGIERELTDASVGIVVGMLAFLFPADILPKAHQTQIIEWVDMLKRLPWGVIFILGSSSTITTAIENNGVYEMLEEKLLNLALPPFYHQYIAVLVMGCFGELTTFKSRLRYFTRIGYRVSRKLKLEPLFFLLPVSVVCQLSLILPSASPNNAMAFELGSMTSLQMIVPGFIIKALTIVLYMTLINLTVSPTEQSEGHAVVNYTSNLVSGDQDAASVVIDVAHVAFE